MDRILFNGKLEYDKNSGITSSDDWLFRGIYDYFISKKNYYGASLFFEHDRFQDLNLRTGIGVHVGHQFFESKARNLKVETGLSQIYENFKNSPDSDYIGLTWHINFDQYIFKDFIQFYHEQTGTLDLEVSGKLVFKS